MKKSFICVVMAAFMAAFYFVACGDDDSSSATTEEISSSSEDSEEPSDEGEAKSSSSVKKDKLSSSEKASDAKSSAKESKSSSSEKSKSSSSKKASSSSSGKSSSSAKSSSSEKVLSSTSKDECEEDAPDVCTNDGKGIGIIKKCINGKFAEISCNTVSCNEEGNGCGECVNNVSTCADDKSTYIGTVTKCENGKKVEHACSNASCDGDECGSCVNYEKTCTTGTDGQGRITQCVNGRPGGTIANGTCENNYSCKLVQSKADGPWNKYVCGDCVDGELKCENDANDYGTLYRCYRGEWYEVKEGDSRHKDGFIDAWEPSADGIYQNTKTIDDPAGKEYDMNRAVISVTGYNPNTSREEQFRTTVAATDADYNRRVSCTADKKHLGVCHNSIQYCINKTRGKNGFLIVCQNGELMDFDGNGDNIACLCQAYGGNNGGCSSVHKCYADNHYSTGKEMCNAPY